MHSKDGVLLLVIDRPSLTQSLRLTKLSLNRSTIMKLNDDCDMFSLRERAVWPMRSMKSNEANRAPDYCKFERSTCDPLLVS